MKKLFSLFTILSITLLPLTSFAIAQPYKPGETLDPACIPGETNCYVEQPLVANSNDVYFSNTGNVGIGDATPTAKLDILLGAAQANAFNIQGPSSANYFKVNAIADEIIAIGDSNTGSGATNASGSNFIGSGAGLNATNASEANFFGIGAGDGATNAFGSNFFGTAAGDGATGAFNANFFGISAGSGATGAIRSNFFGQDSGNSATNASNSNFFGYKAGQSATSANNSNFIGQSAGFQASNASYSNLFGYQAGKFFTGNDIGSNNIIIGTNISLPNATANGINLGGILFGSGTYSTTTGDPSITAVSTGKIGIGDVTPDYRLDVEDTAIDNNIFAIKDSDGECLYNPESGSPTISCSSDERLKRNITDASSAIEYFSDFKIKQYDVIASNDHMTGVIAQEVLQTHPELVTTDSNGMYSVQLPNSWQVVKAIQEMNFKLLDINNIEKENSYRDVLVAWFSNAGNKITRIFTGEICLTEAGQEPECLTRAELKNLKSLMTAQVAPSVINNMPTTPTVDTNTSPEITPVENITTTENTAPENPTQDIPPATLQEEAPVVPITETQIEALPLTETTQ